MILIIPKTFQCRQDECSCTDTSVKHGDKKFCCGVDCVGEKIKPGPLKDGACVASCKFSFNLFYCSCKKPTTTPPREETNENVTTGKPMTTSPGSTETNENVTTTGKPMTTTPESSGTMEETNENVTTTKTSASECEALKKLLQLYGYRG